MEKLANCLIFKFHASLLFHNQSLMSYINTIQLIIYYVKMNCHNINIYIYFAVPSYWHNIPVKS